MALRKEPVNSTPRCQQRSPKTISQRKAQASLPPFSHQDTSSHVASLILSFTAILHLLPPPKQSTAATKANVTERASPLELESSLALNKKQLEDQEIMHTFKMKQAHDMHRAAEILWEKGRTDLAAEVNKYKVYANICETLHVTSVERKVIAGELAKELNVVNERTQTLEAEKKELLKPLGEKNNHVAGGTIPSNDDQSMTTANEDSEQIDAIASMSLDQNEN
ncbi:hypothetical protein BDZ45DRAFT_748963 [Acephala macrosclerotiorum]|nr:hypothetical protein BDZ45DRAFT_748963 [Acephala macrosclerotiorum]